MDGQIDKNLLKKSLRLLAERLAQKARAPCSLVACGGSALIATDLVPRTTEDLDVIALVDAKGQLADPDPLPEDLVTTAREVAPDAGPETHDVSVAFRRQMISMLEQLDHEDAARNL